MLVRIAKSLCFAAFASDHTRRGSMLNRSISLPNVTLTTQYSEEPFLCVMQLWPVSAFYHVLVYNFL
jgi:hypothetical protein